MLCKELTEKIEEVYPVSYASHNRKYRAAAIVQHDFQ